MNSRDKSVILGLVGAAVADIPVHEAGHYAGAIIAGGNPEYEFGKPGVTDPLFTVFSRLDHYSDGKEMIAILGGPVAEYSVAFALAYIGRQLERTRYRTLKEASKVMSTFISWVPFVSSLTCSIINTGDYQRLNDFGLQYPVTIPVTFLLGAGITFYNFKKRATLDNTQAEVKEKLLEHAPSATHSLNGRRGGESPLEVNADKLCVNLFDQEVPRDEILLRPKD